MRGAEGGESEGSHVGDAVYRYVGGARRERNGIVGDLVGIGWWGGGLLVCVWGGG